jgi:hypothetical protein
MKALFLSLICLGLLAGCRKETLEVTPSDGPIEGRYRVEADPLRCALPTSNWMSVARVNGSYQFSYDRFGKGPFALDGVEARKLDEEKYELWRDGQRVGQYARETMNWRAGKPKLWVLTVQHDAGKPSGVDFMGVKE